MKKKLFAAMLATTMVVSCFAGCGDTAKDSSKGSSSGKSTAAAEKEDVKLTVWGAEEDQDMLAEMIDGFKTEYADKANFDISLGVESESTAKDDVLADVEAAADVYAFADDQLNELVAGGALQEITLDPDTIISDNGGEKAGAVQAASKDGKLYAYPMTADNGYFMFYNKKYFKEDDVASLDAMLKVAADNSKKVSMDLANGWYIYSFFQGAGLELTLNEDGTNKCTWNATDGDYTGADVANALLDITSNKGFSSLADEAFVSGLKDGSVIAGVSGTWNAKVASDAWGDDYAAVKLPTYTVKGEQVQMASFAGYKLIGVNPYSKFAGYAMLLGQYLTNYDNQVKRFETRGLGPSNVKAAESDAVQANPAIAALAEQASYATVQRIGDKYWDPAATFGKIMVQGNSDKKDIQDLLDTLVKGVQAKAD